MTAHPDPKPPSSRPVEVRPELPNTALPTANWADAFEVETERHFANMVLLAEQTVGSMPRWAGLLLDLRNLLVAPFGLKPDGSQDAEGPDDRVGIFPILERGENRIVLGLDDKHLDFRILVERFQTDNACRVRATTLVDRHNIFGRFYIAIVVPFHRVIVRSVLKQAV